MQNPSQVTNPTVWAKVSNDIGTLLAEFGKLPMTVVAGHSFAADTKQGSSSGSADVDMDGGQEVQGTGGGCSTSVKYLSSSKLFGLQVRVVLVVGE